MIGQTVSHYRILEKIGEGGMGVVYKAEDTKLKRSVALKFLPTHLSASEQDKARFIQEAQAASALNHPNVCTIHDIQEHDGQMFIVMEYIDGQTLREKKDHLNYKQAIEISIQVADGLAAAHEKGIVHRDIKPENIMLRKDGIAQIMDFGLAKLRGVSRLTKEGSTVGTAGYMSPEQVQGQEADHRSDIFSLGVLLYELITGQLPFKGVHETALAYEIVNVDAPPMSSVKPEIDPSLDAIVLECLEKDPNERTQSAKQVSIDLKRFKRESSRQRVSRVTAARPVQQVAARAAARQPRMRWLWPSVAGVLAAALIVSVWLLSRGGAPPRAIARFAIVLPKDQKLEIINYNAVAISPDGSRIVYRADGKLFQRRLENLTAEAIPGTADGSAPFFSPDGRWLAFFSGGMLRKVPVSGGSAIGIAESQNTRGGTWTQDGRIIFTPSGRDGLFQVGEGGGEIRPLTTVDTTKNERTHRWPQALPDGKSVLYTVGTVGSPDYYEDASIEAVTVSTGERKTLLKGASMARYVPTGYLIYSHTGALFAVGFDLDRLEVTGTSFPVVENVSSDVTTGASHFACSSNGVLAYIPGRSNLSDRTLALVDLAGKTSVLPAVSQSYVDPRISPDGKRIAVAIQSSKDFDIWVYDIPRNTMSRLTFTGSNRSPVWSPDGRRIAYSNNTTFPSGSGGKSRVAVIAADGSGTPEEFVLNNDRNYVSCWSRDGSTLLVTVPQPGKGWDLWVLPLTGDRKPWPFLSTKFDESFASLSPNGKWLAYVSNETGISQVYVRPFPHGEGKWQIAPDVAFNISWSADGQMLYYSSLRDIRAVTITGSASLAAGPPTVMLKNYEGTSVESAVTFDLAPGGRSILVTIAKEGEEAPQQVNVVMNWFDAIQQAVNSGR
jgi:Tol biopolymer transport system component/predicted Ser/Thr protein kinase